MYRLTAVHCTEIIIIIPEMVEIVLIYEYLLHCPSIILQVNVRDTVVQRGKIGRIEFQKVTKQVFLLNLQSKQKCYRQTVDQNWHNSHLGNFADTVYLNKQPFLHQAGDVCTL